MGVKRSVCLLLVAFVLALTVSPAASASTLCGVILMPWKDGCVNVREGAGTQYGVISWAYNGDSIEILSVGDQWDKVRVADTGVVGYVRNVYIAEMTSVTNVAEWGSVAYAVSKRAGIDGKLEVEQGKRLAVTGVLEDTDKESAIGHVGSWYEVQLIPTKRTGYSYRVYLADGVPAKTNAMVNLRRYDNPKSKILRVLDPDTEISVLKAGEKWSKVKVGRVSGFMYNKYITLYDAAQTGDAQ